jgi:hypothetical protein
MTEIQTRKLFIDLRFGDTAPTPGSYLVTIGKKGVGSVYLLHSVTKVNTKTIHRLRYNLRVQVQNELKPYTVHDESTGQVWVRGEVALGMQWYKRDKKKRNA